MASRWSSRRRLTAVAGCAAATVALSVAGLFLHYIETRLREPALAPKVHLYHVLAWVSTGASLGLAVVTALLSRQHRRANARVGRRQGRWGSSVSPLLALLAILAALEGFSYLLSAR